MYISFEWKNKRHILVHSIPSLSFLICSTDLGLAEREYVVFDAAVSGCLAFPSFFLFCLY